MKWIALALGLVQAVYGSGENRPLPPPPNLDEVLQGPLSPAAFEELPPGQSARITATWQNRIVYTPDPTRGGALGAGLAGRVYLFDKEAAPVKGDGEFVVAVFDDSRPADRKALMTWLLDPQTFKRLYKADPAGWGHTLFLPWPDYPPDLTKLRVRCCFLSAKPPRSRLSCESQITLTPEKVTDEIAQVVSRYFANISCNRSHDNAGLFVGPQAVVVGIPRGYGTERIWHHTAEEVRARMGEMPMEVTVDSIEVDVLDGALAVARVRYHNPLFHRRAVFTLTSEGGAWRIASLVFETRQPAE